MNDMPEREIYQPTSGDLAQAEALLTPEQQAASEDRAAAKFQERRPFGESGDRFTDKLERRPPTPEQRREIGAGLDKLGDLFAGSDIRWRLDGAINISLMTKPPGEYIGAHKDFDVSIEQADTAKLDGLLEKKGYGLFISRLKVEGDPKSSRVMERVGASRLTGDPADTVMIGAIDAAGKLRSDEQLDFVDVHVVRRDQAGRALGPFGKPLPEKWLEARTVGHNGRELKISDPRLVAYYKVREGRPYDLADVRHLVEAGRITAKEAGEIEAVIGGDLASRREMVSGMTVEVLSGLGADVRPDTFTKAFAAHPRVAGRITDPGDPQLAKLEQVLGGLERLDAAKISEALIEVFSLGDYEQEQRRKVGELRAMVREQEDAAAAASLRRDIGKM